MKNLLSAWSAEEKAEFYCDVEPPDFSEAEHYFRVTDMQMLTALAGKKAKHIFSAEAENEADAARGRPEGGSGEETGTHSAVAEKKEVQLLAEMAAGASVGDQPMGTQSAETMDRRYGA